MTVNFDNLNLKKNLSNGFKIICLFVCVDQNVYKTAKKNA